MRIEIEIIIFSIYFSICEEVNLVIGKEHSFKYSECEERMEIFNITNHHLAKLEKLGNEDLKFPLILVTGSHGKGSTVLKIAEALTNAGYITGSYTKPYPEFEERYRVDGIKMPLKTMCEIYKKEDPFQNFISCNQNIRLIMICFEYFSMKKVEMGVIEAHLGGLYDTTNYLSPILVVITNHLLEHFNELGETIKKISLHKCGIIKHKLPVILGHAIDIQPLEIYSRQLLAPITIIYPNRHNYTFDELNSKTAAEACYVLKNNKLWNLTKYSVEQGMRKRVSGRMQTVPLSNQKELINLNKYPKAVIIDYPTGVHSYKLSLREIKQNYPDTKIRIILAISKKRDGAAIIKYLFENVDYIHLTSCVPNYEFFECYEQLSEIVLQLPNKLKAKCNYLIESYKYQQLWG